MFYLPSALSNITTRLFMNDCCLLLSRTLPVSLCLSLKRTLVGGRRFRHNFWTFGIHVFLGTATIGTLGRRAESVVECEQVSFVLVLWYQRARSSVLLLLWTTISLHNKGVEYRSRKVYKFRADKRIHVW